MTAATQPSAANGQASAATAQPPTATGQASASAERPRRSSTHEHLARIRRGSTGRTTASWRVVVFILVLVMALAVLLPSLRAYVRQRDRLAELRADAEAASAEVADLEAELARWDDPAYVIARARERLSYVLPGETPYRVIDPETATGAPDPVVEPDAPAIRDGAPWYSVVWGSLENPEGG